MAGKRKSDFPSETELKKIRTLSKKMKGSRMLPSDASMLDRAKYKLCSHFIVFMQKNNLNQRELAKKLGVSESRVSEIVHYYIDKITLDKLIELHERVDTRVTIKVA